MTLTTSVAVIGLLFKAEKKRWILASDTFVILLLYIGLMVMLFFVR